MRGVCARAGLTDRYFYESFTNRDELLVAVFNEVLNEVLETTGAVVAQVEGTPRDQARAAVLALLTFTDNDPRKARLIFREPFSDSALIAAGMVGATGLTQILAHAFPSTGSGARRAMTAIAQGGALATVLATYQIGTLKVKPEDLVEFCAEIIAP